MSSWGVTEDTKRQLKEGEGAYYIEGAMEWWDSWIQMIKSCFSSGMTKEEIREALDTESENCFIYWTEFYEE